MRTRHRWTLGAVATALLSSIFVTTLSCGDGGTEPLPPPEPPRATSITVNPASARLAALGDSVRFTAEVRDQNGNVMAGAAVSWSSNNASVATVNTSGVATAAGDGTATITASSGSASGTAALTVERQATAVTVVPAEAELVPGESVQLDAEAEDANGFTIASVVFAWSSSDTAVAVVDSTGLVLAVWDGEAAITAAAGSVSASATVAVGREVASVIVTPHDDVLAPGDTVQLSAEARDAQGARIPGVRITWESSDASVATVDTTGLVMAVGPGEAVITAMVGSVSGSATVTVSETGATVIVMPAATTVVVGDSLQLFAEARDRDGADIVDAVFAWESSDESVATVDAAGLVRAVAEGRTTITAESGSATGSATLTVAEMTDRGALVAFYRSTGGREWLKTTNWLSHAPLETWHGVDIDKDGRVVSLELASNNLSGVIPSQVQHLTRLESLDLRDNVLGGRIPPEIARLVALESLYLSENLLSGPIPPEIGELSRIGTLGLDRNKLSGPIPPEIEGLGRLVWLDLHSNDLSGELPAELALPRLEYLDVRANLLKGPIPRAFLRSNLRRFASFEVRHSNLYLCVPGTSEFVAWHNNVGDLGPSYCNASDMAALESLHASTGGANWTRTTGWLSRPALGEWHGVETDSLGRVVALDLAANGLSGQLPSQFGHLSAMAVLKIGDNALTGRLPASLTSVPLREFNYADTELCTPTHASFGAWLNSITVHEGTGVECTALTDRDILGSLYRVTGGPNWRGSDNWLTDAPLQDWYGVGVDESGRVTQLNLSYNNLTGPIPSELGQLTGLELLRLDSNPLTGAIPPELGNLPNLKMLYLFFTELTGTIPPEIGNLSALEQLWLEGIPLEGPIPKELGNLENLWFLAVTETNLEGPIPPELGRLSKLERLFLGGNHFTGSIPPELGNLKQLKRVALEENNITGPIPPELGGLTNLEVAFLYDNRLTGSLPPALGNLPSIRVLHLANNDLGGALPPSIGNLATLEHLILSHNPRMSGTLPRSIRSLQRLTGLLASGTGLCAPRDAAFVEWLETVQNARVSSCRTLQGSTAYLTQAVQSLDFPVPLVASEPALLRVFVTAAEETAEEVPPVRATFFKDGAVAHVIDIPQGSAAIPVEIEEGELAKSANADVPAHLVQPGLEMVIEIDPDSTLDPGLGVQERIPATGRQAVDVRDVPAMHLTVVPLLLETQPDSSILEFTDGLTAQDAVLWETRTLLPVGDLQVAVHDPVWTSTNDIFSVLNALDALRVMEGRRGHYLGTMWDLEGAAGVADLGGWTVVAPPAGDIIAHELGHNIGLGHAPCGNPLGVDGGFPSPAGAIASWGYDFRDGGRLVPPSHKDLMSYCAPRWISGLRMA